MMEDYYFADGCILSAEVGVKFITLMFSARPFLSVVVLRPLFHQKGLSPVRPNDILCIYKVYLN